jgi:hypothetical protein
MEVPLVERIILREMKARLEKGKGEGDVINLLEVLEEFLEALLEDA